MDLLTRALEALRAISRICADHRTTDAMARDLAHRISAGMANDIDLFKRKMKQGANDNGQDSGPSPGN